MDEQIRYQFARFKDFYDATKQHVTAESEEPLSFQVPKQAFAKGASLGNVKSPLRKLRKRMEKHLGGSPALLNHCWKELTREMVEMVKDVKTWRDQWYEGVKMRPEPDELEYEMNDLGRSIWGVCFYKCGLYCDCDKNSEHPLINTDSHT